MNTVRFKIPKSVADGIRIDRIKRQARAALVTDVRLAHDDKNVASNELRITCSMAMAIYFVEALRHLSDRAKAQRNHVLVFDCGRAATAAFQAIEKADRTPAIASNAPVMSAGAEHHV